MRVSLITRRFIYYYFRLYLTKVTILLRAVKYTYFFTDARDGIFQLLTAHLVTVVTIRVRHFLIEKKKYEHA